MESVNYYVCSCLHCNSIVLVKVDFLEFNDHCCLDFRNLKILNKFNDEIEAKNYYRMLKKDEED